jgi:myo-inositol 2-dehydrogenase/D-chiro-inositol 1-dehydrogenase
MKVAMIGAGRIGHLHGRILAEHLGIADLLVADADPARAATLAGALAGLATGSVTAVTVEDAVATADAVVIAASTDAHPGLVRASIARGLPTFCEKPLAGDLTATIDLAAEIESSGVPFQLGFQRRFDPAYREARRLVAAGELGTLYLVRLAGHDPAPPPEAYIAISGGLFRDFSIHDFDILRWMTGAEVEEVYADGSVRGSPVFREYGDVDMAVVTLRLTGDVLATLEVARHDPRGYDVRAELFGSLDSVGVGTGPRTPLRSLEPGVPAPVDEWVQFLDRFADAYRTEIQEFVRVARIEIPSPCTALDGVEALRISEAVTLAVREHRVVRLSEVPTGRDVPVAA